MNGVIGQQNLKFTLKTCLTETTPLKLEEELELKKLTMQSNIVSISQNLGI